MNCPVLAINGSNDVQVPAEKNLAGIKSALESGGNKSIETLEMDGLNLSYNLTAN
ncbi:MAG: hypothetical protein LC664_02550 [Flavobacteriales bacterium]|nr:hypothetical protein [Flavobacteriales bacterium]